MTNQVNEIHGMYTNYAEATNLQAQRFEEEKLKYSELSDLMEKIKDSNDGDLFTIKKFGINMDVSK